MKIENHFVSEIMETKGIITDQEFNFTAHFELFLFFLLEKCIHLNSYELNLDLVRMQSFSLRRASREQAPLCIIASSAQEGAHLTAAPGTSDALTCPGSSLEDAPCAVVQEAASSLIW